MLNPIITTTMNIQEFQERTGIMPQEPEWDTITIMYLHCEVDKDEFCKLWCKMYPERVERAKEKRKESERVSAFRDRIGKIKNKIEYRASKYGWCKSAEAYLTIGEIDFLNDNGVTTSSPAWHITSKLESLLNN